MMNRASSEKNSKLVSVCIPSYNASKFIDKTIKSVLNSTYPHFEIIVNDDASTDDTKEKVLAFDDPRINFFQNTSNQGPGKNWNRALEKATGEFVGFLNHDDLYGPFWLTFAVYTFNKYPQVGWIASAYQIINEMDQTVNISSFFNESGHLNRREAFLGVIKSGLGLGYIARREILNDVNFYDEDLGPFADWDLYLRLSSRYSLYFSHYPHVSWRSHQNNLTQKHIDIDRAKYCFRILKKIFSNRNLSKDLLDCKKYSYLHIYSLMIKWMERSLETKDLKTVHDFINLWVKEGYFE